LTTAQTDYLNIGFMLVSLAAALILPFELFLFSYAILGPLHYITEISWLNQRDFFLKRRADAILLIVLSVLVFLQFITAAIFTAPIKNLAGHSAWFLLVELVLASLVIIAFAMARVMTWEGQARNHYEWLFGLVLMVIILQILLPSPYRFFSMMLPTVIHVCIFTGMFILSGTMKNQSFSGYLCFAVYIILLVLLFIPGLLPVVQSATAYGRMSYANSGFDEINHALISLVGKETGNNNTPLFPFAWQIQAFIAFIYTYHYLNWFSKTGLVGWHKVPFKHLMAMLILWGLIILLYLWNYRIGFMVLFLFSMLHVILEFPLNHRVMGQIYTGFAKKLRRGDRLRGDRLR